MKTKYIILLFSLFVLATGCEDSNKELEEKKEELAEKKKSSAALRAEIDALEKEIANMDPEFAKANRKSVLISTTQAETGAFEHFVEVTGSVLSKRNVSISGEVAGRIQEMSAMEGMRVTQGQTLARIDAESIQRNIDEVEKQLELATTIFEKQERLWNQEIGTEVQFLEAKK